MANSHPSALVSLTETMRPAIQKQLRSIVQPPPENDTESLRHMLAYQLGWVGEGAGPDAYGKQIRPILTLLTTQAGGGKWKDALPAAAAVELLHNFSLIHDDIQDNSPTRRGRRTVWKKWGRAKAINAGDAMFTLANRALLKLEDTCSPDIALHAHDVFQRTSFRLTEGQHLDLSFEERNKVTLDEYWQMVSGKTAALLGGATEIGAICARAGKTRQEAFHEFGIHLGLAFQVLDDILGIWGEQELIGKSNESDLVTGKKTLPILYGIAQEKAFHARWMGGDITPDDIPDLAQILEEEGARTYASSEAARLTETALSALEAARPTGEAGLALQELANKLLQREG